MRKCRGASNKASSRFFPQVPQRSADFVEPCWASRSAAEFFSAPTATAPARVECARSLFSVLKRPESEEEALKRTTVARQLAASTAGKSSSMKYPGARIAVASEQADFPFHEPATVSGPFRAALRSAAAGSVAAKPAIGCGPFLFLVGQVRPLVLMILIRIAGLSLPDVESLGKMWACLRPADHSRGFP